MASTIWLYESGDDPVSACCQAVFRSEDKAREFWEKSKLTTTDDGGMYCERGDWWHKMTRVACDPLDVAALQAELNRERRAASLSEIKIDVPSA